MALPNNALSTDPAPGAFIGARGQVFPDLIDYADGPIALQNPFSGLDFQVWKTESYQDVVNDRIVLSAPTVPEFVVYTGQGITEVSLAFDINANFCLAFVEAGVAKLLWYDSTVANHVITEFGSDVSHPRIALDETRPFNSANADIIFAYIRDNQLCYRQQRDRYTIERVLSSGPWIALDRIGMGSGWRFQFQVVAP